MSTTQRTRDRYYRRKYGITLKQFDSMMKHSDGRCWICDRLPKRLRLNVDHVHSKIEAERRVRGLLCYRCNKYLVGRYKANHAPLFERAAKYLASDFDGRIL